MPHSGTSWRSAAVIVTSDTCFQDSTQDQSGTYVADQLERLDIFQKITKTIIDDDLTRIRNCLIKTLADSDPALIITVGGTGLCPRDVTPEATSNLYDKICSGIATALLFTSLRYSPHAALSRLTSGVVGRCLVVNFPGSLKACRECFACLEGFLKHALDQVRFDADAIKETHRMQANFTSHATLNIAISNEQAIISSSNHTNEPFTVPQQIEAKSLNESLGEKSHLAESISTSSAFDTNQEVHNLSELESNNSDSPASQFCSDDETNSSESKNLISNELSNPIKLPSKKILATQSAYPLFEYSDALDVLGALSYHLLQSKEEIYLESFDIAEKILGNVLAVDLRPKQPVPVACVSTMDGYVVNVPIQFKNIISSFKLIQATLIDNVDQFETKQSEPSGTSSSFFCYQVNTGGRLPKANFAVVPAESSGPISSENLVPLREIKTGAYIREAGSDLNANDVLEAGTTIGPVELSLVMAMGHRKIDVFKKPTLGILSTGDELIDFFSGGTAPSNSVVDTNGPLLASLFKMRGYPVQNFGITKDEPEEILLKITDIIKKCDILVITGGASMGSKDHVKDVIEHISGTIHFGRVNIKPGKPAAFSSLTVDNKRKFIFSLPGNPVSAYVTSLVLVVPFIEHGTRNHFKVDSQPTLDIIGDYVNVVIDQIIDGDLSYEFDGRLEFVRAKFSSKRRANDTLNSPFPVTVSVKQQSSRMLNLKDCDCLIIIDPALKGSKFLVGQTYRALKLGKN